MRLGAAPEQQRLNSVIANMQRDIVKLQAERAALRKQLVERFPDYAQLVEPKPPTPAQVQAVLGEGEAAVSFYVAETRIYIWTINRERVSLRVQPYGWAQAEADTAALRRGFDLTDGTVKHFDMAAARVSDTDRAGRGHVGRGAHAQYRAAWTAGPGVVRGAADLRAQWRRDGRQQRRAGRPALAARARGVGAAAFG
ncbi:MAG: hypothetical protein MO853_12900 [Candidatus Protistobacter heckmanni]|nr:hypothetical protein [Candidatus Protistobacter heckmanni]